MPGVTVIEASAHYRLASPLSGPRQTINQEGNSGRREPARFVVVEKGRETGEERPRFLFPLFYHTLLLKEHVGLWGTLRINTTVFTVRRLIR